jgi:serine/threonine protein kinase
VLYEMLTGKRAFRGEDVSDTIAAILRAELDYGELPRDTPTSLRRVLELCLTKDAKWRLQAIGDVRLVMERWWRGTPAASERFSNHAGGLVLGWGATNLSRRFINPRHLDHRHASARVEEGVRRVGFLRAFGNAFAIGRVGRIRVGKSNIVRKSYSLTGKLLELAASNLTFAAPLSHL